MKSDENKTDEILREKFSSKNFPFDEYNWELLEEKLDGVRRMQRIRKTALIFSVGLMAGIAVMFPFVNMEQAVDTKTASAATETIKTESAQVPNANTNLNAGNDVKVTAESAGAAQNVVNENENSVVEKSSKGLTPQGENVAVSEKPASAKPLVVKKESSKMKEAGIVSDAQQSAAASTAADHQAIGANTVQDNETKNSESQNAPASADPINSPDNTVATGAIAQNAVSETNTAAKDPVIESHPEQPEQVKENAENATSQESKEPASTTADTSATDAQNTDSGNKPDPQSMVGANIFYIEAGANYTFGWNYGNISEGKGFSPVFGIGYAHNFTPKWALYTGVQYGSITHLNVSQKTFTTSLTDFGSTSVDSTISTKWIHYMVVPLFLQYDLDSKNSIAIGGTMGFLINTTSDVIVKSYSDFKPVEQSDKTSTGYTQGYNSFNATASVAYRRRISGKFSILAEMDYGLLDIKDDAFFSEQTFERSTGIKLLLSYNLVNH